MSQESAPTVASTLPPTQSRVGRDWIGSTVGLLVFLAGVGLLMWDFKLAFELFSTPPKIALGLDGAKSMDVAKAGESAGGILIKVVLLVLMAIMGSMVSNRGITLYSACGRGKAEK